MCHCASDIHQRHRRRICLNQKKKTKRNTAMFAQAWKEIVKIICETCQECPPKMKHFALFFLLYHFSLIQCVHLPKSMNCRKRNVWYIFYLWISNCYCFPLLFHRSLHFPFAAIITHRFVSFIFLVGFSNIFFLLCFIH